MIEVVYVFDEGGEDFLLVWWCFGVYEVDDMLCEIGVKLFFGFCVIVVGLVSYFVDFEELRNVCMDVVVGMFVEGFS